MKIVWNDTGEKRFESGVDRGVLFPRGLAGVAWNGLISVEEAVSGGEHTPMHIDGVKYFDHIGNEDYQANIEAFGAPREFARCDGTYEIANGLFVTQQRREFFDFSYRTGIGNDVDGEDHGHKIHLVYNAIASPASKTHRTRGETTEPVVRTWTINSIPPDATTYKPTAHFEIDTTKVSDLILEQIEDIIYGTDSTAPRMPSVEELLLLFMTSGSIVAELRLIAPDTWALYEADGGNTWVGPFKPNDPGTIPYFWVKTIDNYADPWVVT